MKTCIPIVALIAVRRYLRSDTREGEVPFIRWVPPMLSRALEKILLPAYRCCEFDRACAGEMRWIPSGGHVPRGFAGATGSLEEVELVVVVAEPGDPKFGESHDGLETAYSYAMNSFRTSRDVFHQNIRKILNLCWPGTSFEEQMRRTWLTESVLCSAIQIAGPVSRGASLACGRRCLLPQLSLFPNALLVGLGVKAQKRLQSLGIQNFTSAFAVGKPGCFQRGALPSWEQVGAEVQRRGEARET